MPCAESETVHDCSNVTVLHNPVLPKEKGPPLSPTNIITAVQPYINEAKVPPSVVPPVRNTARRGRPHKITKISVVRHDNKLVKSTQQLVWDGNVLHTNIPSPPAISTTQIFTFPSKPLMSFTPSGDQIVEIQLDQAIQANSTINLPIRQVIPAREGLQSGPQLELVGDIEVSPASPVPPAQPINTPVKPKAENNDDFQDISVAGIEKDKLEDTLLRTQQRLQEAWGRDPQILTAVIKDILESNPDDFPIKFVGDKVSTSNIGAFNFFTGDEPSPDMGIVHDESIQPPVVEDLAEEVIKNKSADSLNRQGPSPSDDEDTQSS